MSISKYIGLITHLVYFVYAVPNKYRLLTGKSVGGTILQESIAPSRIGCAALCQSVDICDLSSYNEADEMCTLFHETYLLYPDTPGTYLMIRRRLRMIPAYKYGDLASGQAVCAGFGGTVSTYQELETEFYNYGLHTGSCNMVSNGNVYYALQVEVPGLGYQGINECFWASTGMPYCTVPIVS